MPITAPCRERGEEGEGGAQKGGGMGRGGEREGEKRPDLTGGDKRLAYGPTITPGTGSKISPSSRVTCNYTLTRRQPLPCQSIQKDE